MSEQDDKLTNAAPEGEDETPTTPDPEVVAHSDEDEEPPCFIGFSCNINSAD